MLKLKWAIGGFAVLLLGGMAPGHGATGGVPLVVTPPAAAGLTVFQPPDDSRALHLPHTGMPLSLRPSPAAVKHKSPRPAPSADSRVTAAEQRAFELLNADRQANGLPPLRLNGILVALAETYAQDMIARNYFSHYNPEGQSPFDRMKAYGINYRYAGENLALHYGVDAAEQALMNSSGHRANILSANYSEVGIGVGFNSRGSMYLVQEFIGR